LIKGADNIIKQRLGPKQPFLDYIDGKLSEFSRIGLRTLLMAMKILSDDEFNEFDKAFNACANDSDREEKICK
jgi:magnesium-transporting ATPase (P-type)